MKSVNIAKKVCAVGLVALCFWGLTACSGNGSSSGNGLTGGVAAIVNGVEIPEDKVTSSIQSVRTQLNIDTEEAWGTWLAQQDYTPETVREEVINSFVDQELIRQGANEKGLTADAATVDSYIESMKSQYDSEEKWQEALSGAGMTEEEYRTNIELSLLYNELYASFASDEEPDEADVLSYAQMYASAYDGAKRSSHILFNADDEATAQSVLDQINAGTLDFEAAAQEYSQDGSASAGGDVGWDKSTSFVSEYQTALDGLEKDQVSGLVTTTYGIHIIKCTDVFTAPEEVTSVDQVPTDFIDSIKAMLKSNKQGEAYQTWLTEYRESVDIVINDMPKGLPYDVDMSQYPKPEADETAASEGGVVVESTSSDGTVEVQTESASTTAGETGAEEGSSEASGSTTATTTQ